MTKLGTDLESKYNDRNSIYPLENIHIKESFWNNKLFWITHHEKGGKVNSVNTDKTLFRD